MTDTKTLIVPKYRKLLNDKQLLLIKLVYKFRFVSVGLLQAAQGQSDQSTVNRRLQVLVDQGYLGRLYDGNYRIKGKPASYSIRPKGIQLLTTLGGYSPNVLHAIYGDKSASEEFITHNLNIFALYNKFRQQYPNIFNFFTKSELSGADNFPELLPDAYLTPKDPANAHKFYLECIERSTPLFVTNRKISSYIEHSESEEWGATGKTYPAVLLVVESSNTIRTLHKYIERKLTATGADIDFYTTSSQALIKSDDPTEAIWWQVGEDEMVAHPI